MVEVTELVHDDVIDDGWRGHHTFPMESEVSLWGAGGPAMTEFSHVYVTWFDSDFGSKITNALRNSFQASCNEVITKGGFSPVDFSTIH
jgi:hypothetical protein